MKKIFIVSANADISALVYAENSDEAINIVKVQALSDTVYTEEQLDKLVFLAKPVENCVSRILGSYNMGYGYTKGCSDYLKAAREDYKESVDGLYDIDNEILM